MERGAARGRNRVKGDGLGARRPGDTYGNQALKPYGWASTQYGITKSDAMREAARQRARDARARGKQTPAQVIKNRQNGLQASAIARGLPAQQASQIKTLGDYSRAMGQLRSRFERNPDTGRYVTQKVGKKVFRVRRDVNWQNVAPRASAYDLRQITGKRHTQQIAKYLSVLGPKSIGEFIAFDKTYYPPEKGKMTIDENELLDFIAYSIAPWENANVGTKFGTHWGPRVQNAPDIKKLQKLLVGDQI